MKYISFSLWGDRPIYNIGALRNSELVKHFYPDWKMIVFHDLSFPTETIELLKENSVETKLVQNSTYGMFWRFFSLELPDCEYSIFRDADSRISHRESLAVNEWIRSGKTLHVMRDHPFHKIPAGTNQLSILGGMWGIKNKVYPIIEMMHRFGGLTEHKYGNDQSFLRYIYEMIGSDKITHDEFFENRPFPIKRENGRFIGERIDEKENPVTDDFKLVL